MRIDALKTLEGRHVGIALRGGWRIDDCQLVSAGRSRVGTLWVFVDGEDTFLPVADVVDCWEMPTAGHRGRAA